jgi:hypothetical protein
MQTARLNRANPEAHLRDTLAKIADGHPISRIDELMPWSTQFAKDVAGASELNETAVASSSGQTAAHSYTNGPQPNEMT